MTHKKSGAKTATQGKARRIAEDPPATKATSTEGLEGAMKALALALDKKALERCCSTCAICARSATTSSSCRALRSPGRCDRGQHQRGAQTGRPCVRSASEGARTGQWALLDYGDFVVHVFLHSAREHYDLEGLWNDAPRVHIDVPAERIPVDELRSALLVKVTSPSSAVSKSATSSRRRGGVSQAPATVLLSLTVTESKDEQR